MAAMVALFSPSEYEGRLASVRRAMAGQDVDLLLVSTPENICYLTGLHDWGFFAPVMLVVPAEGEPVVVTRANKKSTVAHQVANARFEGHADSETVADGVARVLPELSSPNRVGVEMWSSGLPHGLACALKAILTCPWVDASGLVDAIRHVTSPAERDYIRDAARITDVAMAAAIDTVREGRSEAEVAAACQQAMVEAGSTFPGFGPFVRSSPRLDEEHSTWTDTRLRDGDAVLFEVSGCVARYHAPVGRFVHVGHAPDDAYAAAAIARDAFDAVVDAFGDGVLAKEVYAAWQGVLDRAGLGHYHRHHCGYMVGIGIPPSWLGGNRPQGLCHDSGLVIRTGMTFSVHSWLMNTGHGDFFLANTVLLEESGPQVLTRTPMDVTVR
jgi:Xaa-Pro dipeptidase